MASRIKKVKECHYFTQAHSLKEGLKKFRKKGKDGVHKEVKQMNDRTAWKPVHPNDLTTDEKRKFIESIIFHTEKRDVTKKTECVLAELLKEVTSQRGKIRSRQ